MWHAIYWNPDSKSNMFFRIPKGNEGILLYKKLPNEGEHLTYLGILKLCDSDFPIKYPIYNTHNTRINCFYGVNDSPIIVKDVPKEKPHKPIKDPKIYAYNGVIEGNVITYESSMPNRKARSFHLSLKENKRRHFVLRNNVLKRDGNKCLKCGEKQALTMDHILPESLGGYFVYDNLQTLCVWCNEEKGATTVDYRQIR